MTLLQLIDVHSYFGQSHILRGINLSVSKGSIVGLLGRNGMGKTTTLGSIMGLNPPRQGKIIFKGQDIAGKPPYVVSRFGIGLVPQGRRIFPSLTVKENLLISARNGHANKNWSLDKVYSFFPILSERETALGKHLSGGEQQMLAIARALMTNPELILMDEPSEGLAPKIVEQIAGIITQLRDDGYSILLVEQNLALALDLVEYLYVIGKGKIMYESSTDEFRKNEEAKTLWVGM